MKIPKITEKLSGNVSFRDIAIGTAMGALITSGIGIPSGLSLHKKSVDEQVKNATEVTLGIQNCVERLMHNHFFATYDSGTYLHGTIDKIPNGPTFINSYHDMYSAFIGRKGWISYNMPSSLPIDPSDESPTLAKLAAEGESLREELAKQFESNTSGAVPSCYGK